jgi:hypothetical protein
LTVVELISPVWISVLLLGVIWTAVSSAVAPPSIRQVPLILPGAVAGAAIGQLVADAISLDDILLGDAHLGGITVGALLVIVVVRRLAT